MTLKRFDQDSWSYPKIFESLERSSRPHLDYYILMTLATIIAAFGLFLNSTAVIIGAMLVSPLMDPILGVAFATLIGNRRFTVSAAFTLVTGIALSIALSCLIGLMFSSLGTTAEILARTKPNILDLVVALAAGFLGAYVKIRKNISGSIYGVAIAIALVPPLCVIGIGIAMGKPDVYFGASLLFLTNLAGIILCGLLAFLLVTGHPTRKSLKSFIVPSASVLLLAIPLMLSFMTLLQERRLSHELKLILQTNTHTFENTEIVDLNSDLFQKPILVSITIRSPKNNISPRQVSLVQDYLQAKMGKPVHVVVNVLPVEQIESDS